MFHKTTVLVILHNIHINMFYYIPFLASSMRCPSCMLSFWSWRSGSASIFQDLVEIPPFFCFSLAAKKKSNWNQSINLKSLWLLWEKLSCNLVALNTSLYLLPCSEPEGLGSIPCSSIIRCIIIDSK